MPAVVEHVKTELPAVERFPETTPEYATVIGCRVTAVAGLTSIARGKPKTPSNTRVLENGLPKRAASVIAYPVT